MGSFNVSCGLSSLTIHPGDAVGLVLLNQKPTYPRPYRKAESTTKSFLYANDLYHMYLPPVYGVYDDYGNITSVEESPTTRVIEDIFGRSAQAVLNAIGHDRNLYSAYGAIAPLYLPEKVLEVLNDYHASAHEQFEALGFGKIPLAGYDATYSYNNFALAGQLEAPLDPRAKPRFTWTLLNLETDEKLFDSMEAFNGLEGIFSSFALYTRLYPGFAKEDWRAVRQLQTLSAMFFLKDAYTPLADPVGNDKWALESQARWVQDYEKIITDFASGELYSSALSDVRDVTLPHRVWPLLKPLVATDEPAHLWRFQQVMAAVNRLLMPSFSGEQHGNDQASLLLVEASRKILETRKAEFEEEWEDEDF